MPVEVIDGAREAALTFRAVADAFPEALAGRAGGGRHRRRLDGDRDRRPRHVRFNVSLPLGSVRLTEQFIHHDPPRPDEIAALTAAVDDALRGVPVPGARSRRRSRWSAWPGPSPRWRRWREALVSYDPARVHGYRLSQAALAEQVARLRVGTQAARERIVGLDPRRADVILAGALILQRIAAAAAAAEVRVSDRGIRWGLMHELAGKLAGRGVA